MVVHTCEVGADIESALESAFHNVVGHGCEQGAFAGILQRVSLRLHGKVQEHFTMMGMNKVSDFLTVFLVGKNGKGQRERYTQKFTDHFHIQAEVVDDYRYPRQLGGYGRNRGFNRRMMGGSGVVGGYVDRRELLIPRPCRRLFREWRVAPQPLLLFR
jgi:hypothetical protein